MYHIVREFSPELVELVMASADEFSPLRYVAPHVRDKQLARAGALVATEYEKGISFSDFAKIRNEAEKELVRLLVREEFCGLCGRYTDHRGEH